MDVPPPAPTNQDIPPEIRSFLENTIRKAGMAEQDDAITEEMIQSIYGKLNEYLSIKLAHFLPTEKLPEYSRFNQQGTSVEQIQTYLFINVPNAKDIMKQAYIEFRQMIIDNAKENN